MRTLLSLVIAITFVNVQTTWADANPSNGQTDTINSPKIFPNHSQLIVLPAKVQNHDTRLESLESLANEAKNNFFLFLLTTIGGIGSLVAFYYLQILPFLRRQLDKEVEKSVEKMQRKLDSYQKELTSLLEDAKLKRGLRNTTIGTVSLDHKFWGKIRNLGFPATEELDLEGAKTSTCPLLVFDGDSLTDEQILEIVKQRPYHEIFVGFRSGIFKFDQETKLRFTFSNSLISTHSRLIEALEYLQHNKK